MLRAIDGKLRCLGCGNQVANDGTEQLDTRAGSVAQIRIAAADPANTP